MKQQLFNDETDHGRAILSNCGTYRYTLERAWASIPRYVLWLMLNPSTADASVNDATIRRCLGFAKSWGFTGILVGNLYAYRSTDPRELWREAAAGVDVVGPENARHVAGLIRRSSLVVCAWGQVGPVRQARFDTLQELRRQDAPFLHPHVLRLNEGPGPDRRGEPSHPLRLGKNLEPKRWDVFDRMGNGHGG